MVTAVSCFQSGRPAWICRMYGWIPGIRTGGKAAKATLKSNLRLC